MHSTKQESFHSQTSSFSSEDSDAKKSFDDNSCKQQTFFEVSKFINQMFCDYELRKQERIVKKDNLFLKNITPVRIG